MVGFFWNLEVVDLLKPTYAMQFVQNGVLKGQLISKCLLSVFNSSKKRTKKFDLTAMIPRIVFVRFLEPVRDHTAYNW
jgi:hypothetical protein